MAINTYLPNTLAASSTRLGGSNNTISILDARHPYYKDPYYRYPYSAEDIPKLHIKKKLCFEEKLQNEINDWLNIFKE